MLSGNGDFVVVMTKRFVVVVVKIVGVMVPGVALAVVMVAVAADFMSMNCKTSSFTVSQSISQQNESTMENVTKNELTHFLKKKHLKVFHFYAAYGRTSKSAINADQRGLLK